MAESTPGFVPCGAVRRRAAGIERTHGVASRRGREYSSAVGEAPSALIPLSLESRIVLSKDQVSCDLAGEAAIVNLKNGVYYGLDPVGARIWNLAREPITVAQILDALLRDYEVDRLTLESDVRHFVRQLAEHGLVEISA
jgi:hypothetical protein